jgi:beta-N-acetylhexosaminidase
MAFPRTLPRTLTVLAAASALLMACHGGPKPPAASKSKVTTATAAPPPPNCGDPTTLPPRDKLAQLLMVGVKPTSRPIPGFCPWRSASTK